MSILTILLVGIGGFLGTICRYLLGTFITSVYVKGFPLSTFIVNIVGCLLIGCLVELARFHKISDTMVLFLATGFCGGFTTFSSYILDIFSTQHSNITVSIIYAFASIIIGYIFLFIGVKTTSYVLQLTGNQ